MSTFKGIIAEFPQIRIDYFRQQSEHKAPLACFLSHVQYAAEAHTRKALTRLVAQLRPSYRPRVYAGPFRVLLRRNKRVYCSFAVVKILLRLEKYHYRINFAKGILESRNVTYHRSMRRLAKPLPLDTPTSIELSPGNSIRVTLIEANHCIGAVMFLIEGNGQAILYTGDIRAEPWWVNSLVQNPVLSPYTTRHRRLDCVYLDTTFATKNDPYRNFPSKADGIRELFDKVSKYSNDTVFYFHAWTFGYENVWIALSTFLRSRIHLDDYRARLYGSLSTLDKRHLRETGLDVPSDNRFLRESGIEIREAPALCGFRNGNHIQPGCLTSRESVRIHSCERGMGCRVMEHDAKGNIVHIIPIITRSDGADVLELGAGGGKGDLDHKEEIEMSDTAEFDKLMTLCRKTITDEKLLAKAIELLQRSRLEGQGKLDLDMQLQDTEDALSLETLVSVLSSRASSSEDATRIEGTKPRLIRFPYSRHSSYSELCALLAALMPKDVYPCTVDEKNWVPDMSVKSLFGAYCSADEPRHDLEMVERLQGRTTKLESQGDVRGHTQSTSDEDEDETEQAFPGVAHFVKTVEHPASAHHTARKPPPLAPTPPPLSPPPTTKKRKRPSNRRIAYEAAIGTHLTWADYGGLESTRRRAEREEKEL